MVTSIFPINWAGSEQFSAWFMSNGKTDLLLSAPAAPGSSEERAYAMTREPPKRHIVANPRLKQTVP